MSNTYPSTEEWQRFLGELEYYAGIDKDLKTVLDEAQTLSKHPEFFDAKLNGEKKEAYFG